MTLYHVAEFLIVAAAVGFSGWSLAKRFLPHRGAASGSGCSSCSSCSGCGTQTPSANKSERPLRPHR